MCWCCPCFSKKAVEDKFRQSNLSSSVKLTTKKVHVTAASMPSEAMEPVMSVMNSSQRGFSPQESRYSSNEVVQIADGELGNREYHAVIQQRPSPPVPQRNVDLPRTINGQFIDIQGSSAMGF